MAVNLTITLDSNQPGPEPAANGRIRERVKVVGASASANDTGSYTSNFVTRPDSVTGLPVSATFSGQTCSFTDLVGIGSKTLWGWVEGFA
jgi:hypothetical protein